jgi:hypothetical protein
LGKEKNFKNKVKRYLEDTHRAYYIKYWGGAKYTKSGVPDILVCLNGYALAVETKAPEGRPTALQLYNIRKIREAGGIAVILYPDDYDLFVKLCEALKGGIWSVAEDYQYEIDDRLSLKDKEVLYGKKS